MLNAQRTSALWAAYGQYSKRNRQVPYSRLGYRASCLSRAVHHWAAVSSKQCRCCRLLFVWLSACLLATGNPDQLCSSFLFFLYSQLLWRAYDRGKRWGTNSTAPIFNRHIMIVAQRGNFVLLNILECKKCHVSNRSTIQKNIFSFPRCFSFFPHLQKIWITRSITG